jgi:hypothetical protein
MIKRLIILQIVLLAGLSLVFTLPRTPEMKAAALNTDLPNYLTLTGWAGQAFGQPSVEEKEILAKDTKFFRRDYRREVSISERQAMTAPELKNLRTYPNLVDMLNAGIVLSGEDLSNSIHALERCLTSQGFNIPSATTMHIKLRSGQTLAVRRLLCEHAVPKSAHISRSIAYYWFVGHDYVTNNHVSRGLKDFADRVFYGYAQHWAYITVTAQLDGGFILREGEDEKKAMESGGPFRRPLTEQQADALVDEFIADLGPDIIRIDEVKEWPEE